MLIIMKLKQVTFLSYGRKPEVNISRVRTVASHRYSNKSSLQVTRNLI